MSQEEEDAVNHVSAFKQFVDNRVSSEGMARLALYAAYRQRSYIKQTAKKRQSVSSGCPKCGTTFPYQTRIHVDRKSGTKKKEIRLRERCVLCHLEKKSDPGSNVEAGSQSQGKDDKRNPVPKADETPVRKPVTTTPSSTNLQKLMSAKKRQSLNKGTGLLDFLINSSSTT